MVEEQQVLTLDTEDQSLRVDRAVAQLGREEPCRTATLPLVGATTRPEADAPRLRRRFGSEAEAVAASGGNDAIAPGVPVLQCEVDWAIAAEGAITPEDVADRRLRLDLVPAWRDASWDYVASNLESRKN